MVIKVLINGEVNHVNLSNVERLYPFKFTPDGHVHNHATPTEDMNGLLTIDTVSGKTFVCDMSFSEFEALTGAGNILVPR